MESRTKKSYKCYYFPEELMLNVLLRLPVKALLRFRSASKAICKTIDNPEFISTHMTITNKNNRKRTLVLTMEDGKDGIQLIKVRRCDTFKSCGLLLKTCWEKQYPYEEEKFCASIDGLVLMYRKFTLDTLPLVGRSSLHNRITDEYDAKEKKMHKYVDTLEVWNLFTKKSLILPPCPLIDCIFNKYTLGFAPSTNDYKVAVFDFIFRSDEVNIGQSHHCIAPLCWIYSFNGGNWKTLVLDIFAKEKWSVSHAFASSKRATHWLSADINETARYNPYEPSYTHIVSFDFEVEKFSFVKLPEVEKPMQLVHFVIDDSPAVLGISKTDARIWVLGKNDGDEDPWITWYWGGSNVMAYNFFIPFGKYGNMTVKKILYTERAGSGILYINTDQNVMSFDLKSLNIRHHGIFARSPHLIGAYTESLLLCGMKGNLTVFP